MNRPNDAQLQYVLVNGVMRHVSDFVYLIPRERPPAICPVCKEQVIMALGSVRVHHVKHRPGSDCPAINRDYALHINTVLNLAQVLRGGDKLLIEQQCQGDSSYFVCKETRKVQWCSGWDEVKVEYWIDRDARPDILLLKNGVPIAVVEVKVTHAVEEETAKHYQDKNIRWIEIEAEKLYKNGGEFAWAIHDPFPYCRLMPEPEPWTCGNCTKYNMNRRDEKVQQINDPALIQPYQKETGTCLICGRVTNNWWFYDYADKSCKCRECYKKGLA